MADMPVPVLVLPTSDDVPAPIKPAGGGYSGLCGALRELSVVLDRHQWLDGRALAALTGLRALNVSETLGNEQRSQVLTVGEPRPRAPC